MKNKYQFIISTGGRKWRKTPFAEIEAHSCREAWAEFNSFDRGVPDGHWVKCMLDGKDVEPEPEEDLPRQYTAEEIRDQFINHMWDLVEYWDKHVKDQNMPIDRRLQGLMHSVLTTLDGCSMDLPGFALVTTPHESDKEYHQDQGENWYPENDLEKMNEPVCFMLHEDFYSERLRRDK